MSLKAKCLFFSTNLCQLQTLFLQWTKAYEFGAEIQTCQDGDTSKLAFWFRGMFIFHRWHAQLKKKKTQKTTLFWLT